MIATVSFGVHFSANFCDGRIKTRRNFFDPGRFESVLEFIHWPAQNAELEKREMPADESELFSINIKQIAIKVVLLGYKYHD